MTHFCRAIKEMMLTGPLPITNTAPPAKVAKLEVMVQLNIVTEPVEKRPPPYSTTVSKQEMSRIENRPPVRRSTWGRVESNRVCHVVGKP